MNMDNSKPFEEDNLKDKELNQKFDLSNETFPTKRVVSIELEKILYEPIPVLDKGFIRVIDYMGTDASVVQAARVSYGSGTKQVNQDKGLIYYLLRHSHTTPFEMCEIKLHVKLPIFIARQWIRHRTANVNEYSARYSILSNDYYLPKSEHLCAQSAFNKQGRGENSVPPELAAKVLEILKTDSDRCYENYLTMLNEDEKGNIINEDSIGIARELARINLNLNYYTEWYWKIDLHNFMHFVALRADSHAQYEIRVYAEAMLDILQKWLPLTYGAFVEYKLHGAKLSKTALEIVRRKLKGEVVTAENSGLSKREWSELENLLQ